MSISNIKGKVSPFKGEITVPGDKSISHRALIIGSLANGVTPIKGLLRSGDIYSTANAMKLLGAKIDVRSITTTVTGNGLHGLHEPKERIDAGNSGTTARLLTGLLSPQNFNSEITGDKYLKARPMERVVLPLTLMGAAIDGEENGNKLPLKIYGQILHGIRYELPIASAQLKSALILAGLYAEGDTEIVEPIPTRDHTERMLGFYGVNIKKDNNTIYISEISDFNGRDIFIPADISSAAFYTVGALINPNSELILKNVGLNPHRTGVIEILTKMGGNIEILNERVECGEPIGDLHVKSSKLRGIEIKGKMIPKAIDELPVIAVAACFAEGETIISDANELRVKETDRIKAITTELKKMNADIVELDEGMIINGKEELTGAECDSWADHRIAMSLAIAATNATGDTLINNSDCVSISFPEFFTHLNKLRN